ncbi:MAG: sel1 repeat family protein [Proteobacteria bacterium]|nr:sel1 repeat family protein [Pseudomonadota bacterium]
MYANGEGVAQDLKKAKEYYSHACRHGNQSGCHNRDAL